MSAGSTTKILRRSLAGVAALAIAARSYLVLNSKAASDSDRDQTARTAVLVKQEIVAIKAQEANVGLFVHGQRACTPER
jgi:hypothetical protein